MFDGKAVSPPPIISIKNLTHTHTNILLHTPTYRVVFLGQLEVLLLDFRLGRPARDACGAGVHVCVRGMHG